MDLQLVQRKVLVSGGSRGIGRVIVGHFLAERAKVAFRTRGKADAAEATDCFGERAFDMSADITDPQQACGWVTRSALHLGGIGIVVPNVSVLVGGGDLDTWRRVFKIGLLGSMDVVVATLPWLRCSKAASVVLVSSVSDREVDTFAEPYGVFKAILVHYGKTLTNRHAEDGIRVNTVSPGSVYFEGGVWGAIERDSPETFARCPTVNPMGRMAWPDKVTRAVLFLASPAASFTTGTSLLVDGGLARGI